MTTSTQPVLANACLLADSGVYEEYLSINPIETAPGTHDFVIRSRLETAKNPEGLHTRYRLSLTDAAVSQLHQYLGAYLSNLHLDSHAKERPVT